MRIKQIVLILTLSFPVAVFAQNTFDVNDLANRIRQAEKMVNKIELPANHPEAQQAAEEIVQKFNDEKHQITIQREQERIKEALFSDVMKVYGPEAEITGKGEGKTILAGHERVYLFISSSIPMSTLKTYLAMIERVGDPNVILVMRGFIGGMKTVTPTLEFFQDLIKKAPDCEPNSSECEAFRANIQIDPMLFNRFSISKVPALVFAANIPMVETNESMPESPFFIIEGDAGLDYLLERINREAKSSTLAGLVKAMQGSAK